MAESLPVVLVPGLNCSPRLYAPQMPALWRFGPVTVADHTRDDSMAAIARRILDAAPPRFALAGPVPRLPLSDPGPRADTAEATQRRHTAIAGVEAGRYEWGIDAQFPLY